MGRNRVGKGIIAIVGVIVLFSVTMTAYANSAQKHWTGVDATGAMVLEKDCPIVIEKELLTFDVQEFPADYYHSIEEYLNYTGKVTAEYTFYNPAEYTVTATLLFPFGKVPDYGYVYDNETGEYVSHADALKYNILVNGQAIDAKLRHTLSMPYDQFELNEDLPKVMDGFAEDAFYKQDTPVYCLTYTVEELDAEYSKGVVALKWNGTDTKTKIIMDNQNGGTLFEDGIQIEQWVRRGDKIHIWMIGEYQKLPEWSVYENGACEKKISGKIELDEQEGIQQMSFKEYALRGYNTELGVSEIDWYNARVASLNDSEWAYGVIDHWDSSEDLLNLLLRWYEYEITLAPGEKIVNTVTAPIYPDIDLRYEPDIFTYMYLLSPAQTWDKFGNLEILINTPYYITESSINGFEKTENGYRCKLNGLPNEELEFTLSTSDNPQRPSYLRIGSILSYLVIAFIGISVLGFVALVIGIAVINKSSKKRKRGESYDN